MRTQLPEAVEAEQIRPRKGRVLIRRAMKAEKTKGGIYLADDSRGLSQLGEVLAVGEGVTDLARGFIVVVSQYASNTISCIASSDLSDDIVIAREADVLAVVEL